MHRLKGLVGAVAGFKYGFRFDEGRGLVLFL
jgi:hypothetical protein